jgi:hypothetical protein
VVVGAVLRHIARQLRHLQGKGGHGAWVTRPGSGDRSCVQVGV